MLQYWITKAKTRFVGIVMKYVILNIEIVFDKNAFYQKQFQFEIILRNFTLLFQKWK